MAVVGRNRSCNSGAAARQGGRERRAAAGPTGRAYAKTGCRPEAAPCVIVTESVSGYLRDGVAVGIGFAIAGAGLSNKIVPRLSDAEERLPVDPTVTATAPAH